MLTVPEAAKRVGRNPETVRRWIREGKMRSTRVGTQHLIDEAELEPLMKDRELPLPNAWQRQPDGSPSPNVVRAIRLSRVGR
jgi:excisionase family DNA binding protein